MKQWFRRQERYFDWMAAWFGGSALTAFQLHNPGGQGWAYLGGALLAVAGGITAHCIRPPAGALRLGRNV